MMKKIALLSVLALTIFSAPAYAQPAQNLPVLPTALDNYVKQGAQIRYMGRENGFDAWVTVKQGAIEYYYVPKGNPKLFFRGLMYDGNGEAVTVKQVENLKKNSDETFNMMVGQTGGQASEKQAETAAPEMPKSLSEQLFDNVTSSNWIGIGDPQAPHIYMFIDPQCPHCHRFTKKLYDQAINDGKLQLRIIPVGFINDKSLPQSAFLLGSKNAGDRWINYIQGDTDQIPVSGGLSTQGAESNNAIMLSWKLNATPITVYRSGKSQKIKIIEGPANDIAALLEDLK